MKIKSVRFDREFEVETVKAGATAVNPEDMLVVRYASLKKILEELGETVKLTTEPIIVPPIVCIKATIKDDTGAEVTAYGSVNINKESIIPQKFSVETALSRAVSNAVIDYCQFEGRVYSDVAIPADENKTEAVEEPKPYVPAVKEEAPKPAEPVEEVNPEDDMPDGAPPSKPAATKKAPAKKTAAKKTESAEVPNDPGNFVVEIGNAYTKGKKICELSEKSLNWVATLKPTSEAAEKAQAAAAAYLEAKKK